MSEREDPGVDAPWARPEPLSTAGLRRKREMLPLLQGALVRRRRSRAVLRAAGSAAVLTAVCLALRSWDREGESPPAAVPAASIATAGGPVAPPTAAPGAQDPGAGPTRTAPRIGIVRDDPGVLERWTVKRSVGPEAFIGDEDLLESLRAAGRPEGLVRVHGRVLLAAELGGGPAPGP